MNNEVEKEIYLEIKQIFENARNKAYRTVNFVMVEAYWEIGKVIVEKQGGKETSEYGSNLLKKISIQLTKDYGKGFDVTNLRNMRQFYLLFKKRDTLCRELSWSHYRLLMRVENEKARNFYIEECIKENWSVRQLGRQINTFSYERLLASRGNYDVVKDTTNKEPKNNPKDFVKDPYVLEFIGIEPNHKFYESDLEQGLIDHLHKFLLELGKGYSFVARQKHISFDGRHFYIDLVFYNYILNCFVLIDIKRGDLTHQDIGQMQMYVNYYTRELMNENDNPPIGIILSSDKSETLVKYTLPEGESQIFTSKYKLYIPSEEELIKEINEQILIYEDRKII
ncbi:MAG: DUF1016 family protein [Bacilli bacterium]|nr:DUF1016 family protein [Bacilli bacterium]